MHTLARACFELAPRPVGKLLSRQVERVLYRLVYTAVMDVPDRLGFRDRYFDPKAAKNFGDKWQENPHDYRIKYTQALKCV